MPIKHETRRQLIRRVLTRHAAAGVDVNAAFAVRILQQVTNEFTPLIDAGSVALIYARSLDLNTAAFPWLAQSAQNDLMQPQFAKLTVQFAKQTSPEVIEASCALIGAFAELLDALIGERLTSQIFRTALPPDMSVIMPAASNG